MQPIITKRSVRIAIVLTVATIVTNSTAVDATANLRKNRQPNIVFIMSDDVGIDALGCYGGTSFKTPHLDKLAKTGMRFQHCYSMPVCHPTRICLMTGRYPFRLNRPKWGSFPKSAEKQTFAHIMKNGGYATAIAGKWQLILQKKNPHHPQQLGFDESAVFGWHEGPRYFSPYIWQNGKLRDDVNDRYGPDVYVDYLIDFMTRNQGRPFLAYYSMALCHDVTDDLAEPVPFGPNGRYENYREMVESMDRVVGRLIAALDRLNLREKTLILFTGDNGTPKTYIAGAKNGKLFRKPIVMKRGDKVVQGGKGQLTDAGTRVPLIANWTVKIPPGQVVEDLVDFSDFLPTFAELGGVKLPTDVNFDGRSFAPRLLGKPGTGREWAYSEGRGKQWVRTQRWKLYNDGRLIDIANDPVEESPIPATKQSADAAKNRKRLQHVLNQLAGKS